MRDSSRYHGDVNSAAKSDRDGSESETQPMSKSRSSLLHTAAVVIEPVGPASGGQTSDHASVGNVSESRSRDIKSESRCSEVPGPSIGDGVAAGAVQKVVDPVFDPRKVEDTNVPPQTHQVKLRDDEKLRSALVMRFQRSPTRETVFPYGLINASKGL